MVRSRRGSDRVAVRGVKVAAAWVEARRVGFGGEGGEFAAPIPLSETLEFETNTYVVAKGERRGWQHVSDDQ
jgi:hypothetical protein